MLLKSLSILITFLGASSLFAQAAAPKAPTMVESLLLPMAVVLGIVYFMMIRPQAKKQKQHDDMLKVLKPGDEVLTSSGIIGRVKTVAEQFVSLELSPSTHIKIQKAHITGLTKQLDAPKPTTASPAKVEK